MPITLNHSNIGVQYNTGSNYIIETVKSDLYLRNEIYDTFFNNNRQAAPVTPSIYIENTSNVYAIESYTYTGSANTADYTRVFPKNTVCDILIVGGGGGGGYFGGGGGGGAILFANNITLGTGSYTIKVGKGGTGVSTNSQNGTNGQNSSITINSVEYIARGGGGGGTRDSNNRGRNGNDGGSGGGGSHSNETAYLAIGGISNKNTYSGWLSYGNNGGKGRPNVTAPEPSHASGGGGGAGSVGGDFSYTTGGGNGGAGKEFISTFGTSVGHNGWFGGGGGGNTYISAGNPGYGNGGNGLLGGGGDGGFDGTSENSAQDGLPNTGGGGGGSKVDGGTAEDYDGGDGGSGIVIIRYLVGTIPSTNLLTSEPTVISPVMTETVRSFVHSGGTESQTTHTITVGQNTICDILVVGGGGGGGKTDAGGGGAGGLIYVQNIILTGTYDIKVGKGGLGGTTASIVAVAIVGDKGGNTSFIGTNANYVAYGGGGGGYGHPSDVEPSNLGPYGSSGGLGTSDQTRESFNVNTPGQGYLGGLGTAAQGGGGGGGSGGQGINSGNGGIGTQINITGTNLYYAGGGGGGHNPSGTSGGLGGGGSATFSVGNNATFYGGGGGGGGDNWGNGGNGFSGVVIIKFKSTTNAGILDGITHKRLNFAYNSDNLVAWYKFNGDYLDSSGNGHNLTNVGTVIQSTHIIEGQAVEFDSTDYLEFPASINPYTIWNGKGITFSCWVRFTAHETWARLFEFEPAVSTGGGIAVCFKVINSNNIYAAIYVGIGSTSFLYSNWNNTLITNLNVWRHLVFCIGISGNWDIYLDNVRINGTETANIPNITYNIRYINRSAFAGDGTWDGQMDDFRIYDRALSVADVSSLYNKTYSIPPNTYTLNFPVPTIADINNNSNIVLRGTYDISLSKINSSIIPKSNQYIPKPTTFSTSNISIRYNILNPILDPIGAQWTYNTSNTNVYHMGRVGIGTTSPEYQIDVSGTLNAKAYYFNGVQIGRLSEGMVANVQHLTYTHMEVKNNTGWDAINDDLTTGFVISITPKSNLSKILVNLIAHIGLTTVNDARWWGIKLYRKIGTAAWAEVTGSNGTETGSAATTAGTPVWISHNMGTTTASYAYQIINLTGTYLDYPNTTSTVYYTAYWNQRMGDNPSGTGELWLNRAANQNDAYRPAPSSSWTLKEIWYG
jgi:hypothetical protein